MLLHGDALNRRALPWLRAHARGARPFFLYLHYLDPHDPYDNPEVVDGRSPFYPGYRGELSGRWMHGVYAGSIPLQDPEEDRRHLEALYDSEIHYVDARIGELLRALARGGARRDAGRAHRRPRRGAARARRLEARPDALRGADPRAADRALGRPHAGGHAAAGSGAAARPGAHPARRGGGAPPDTWQGSDLLAALRGESAPAAAAGFRAAPVERPAARRGDRRRPQARALRSPRARSRRPTTSRSYLWRQDLERLERVELYDLAADPGERRNLARDPARAVTAALAPLVHRQLDRQLPGLRVVVSGVPAAARLDGTIRFDRPPTRWASATSWPTAIASSSPDPSCASTSEDENLGRDSLVEGDFGAVGRSRRAPRAGRCRRRLLQVGAGRPHPGRRWRWRSCSRSRLAAAAAGAGAAAVAGRAGRAPARASRGPGDHRAAARPGVHRAMSRQPAAARRGQRVTARSVLVVAPHYDDEVLGCGGLVAQLAAAGAVVRVLFLTDGERRRRGGGRPRRLRRAPARRSRARRRPCSGLAGAEHLGLPDGQLAPRLADAARGDPPRAASRSARTWCWCRRRSRSPPTTAPPSRRSTRCSPRCAAPSSRAGVAAHPPLRGQPPRLPRPAGRRRRRARDSRARDGLPTPARRSAIPTWRAGLGLRRCRAATLGPAAEAAEGYRQLPRPGLRHPRPGGAGHRARGQSRDRADRARGRWSRSSCAPRTARSSLAQALRSLDAGSYRRVEVVLVNDGGAPPPLPDGSRAAAAARRPRDQRAAAPRRPTPASRAARGEFVAFLDDDDLVEPEHLATLVGLVGAPDVRVAYTDAAVGVYELDPVAGWRCAERRLPYSRDFDPDLLAGRQLHPVPHPADRSAARSPKSGPFDETLPFFEDWDFLIRLAALTPFHHLARVTCEYRHFRGGAHHMLGERPRERADFLAMKARVIAKHAARLGPETAGAGGRRPARRARRARRAGGDGRRRSGGAALRIRRAAPPARGAGGGDRAPRPRGGGGGRALPPPERRARGAARRPRAAGRRGASAERGVRRPPARRRRAARRAGQARRGAAASLRRRERPARARSTRLQRADRAMDARTRAWRLHEWWQRRMRPPAAR